MSMMDIREYLILAQRPTLVEHRVRYGNDDQMGVQDLRVWRRVRTDGEKLTKCDRVGSLITHTPSETSNTRRTKHYSGISEGR